MAERDSQLMLYVHFLFFLNERIILMVTNFRTDSYEKDKKRPILRSKSDITYKYCIGRATGHPPPPPPPPLLTSSQLERFFDHLGMDPLDYR